MAGICCRVVGEGDTPTPLEPSRPSTSTRRSMDIVPLKYIAEMTVPESSRKRPKLDLNDSDNQLQSDQESSGTKVMKEDSQLVKNEEEEDVSDTKSLTDDDSSEDEECPKYGVTSVCGRRRDMEDSVSMRPFFSLEDFHFFGVFDGHGCSHVCILTLFN